MSLKSQGTHIYFYDTSGTPALRKLTFPTTLPSLSGGAASQIDTTTLDELVAKTFIAGLAEPGSIALPFNFDPDEVSHRSLYALKGQNVDFIVLFSDGNAAPTYVADAIVPPTTRTSLTFNAAVLDVSIEAGGNDVVRGSLQLQISGAVTPHWKA